MTRIEQVLKDVEALRRFYIKTEWLRKRIQQKSDD